MNLWREPAPGERESAERNWDVMRRAYAERLPSERRRDRSPVIALAAALVVLAAALSPPGHAVWGSLRDAVGNQDHLTALPSGGRVLVNTQDGAWVVSADGSKRFLSNYTDAAWSPHGLYLAAARGNQLVAMEPNGKVHWKLARRGAVHAPQWSYEGFRVAYFAGNELRIVNGDGSGDRLLTRDARLGSAAWERGTHSLAYVNRAGNIVVQDVDTPGSPAHIRTRLSPRRLEWTPNGRLLAVAPHAVGVFARRGPQLSRFDFAGRITSAAVSPGGALIALAAASRGESTVTVNGKSVFSGAGTIADVAWSPDGRWLLLNWTGADKWLFLRTPVKNLVAVPNIAASFGADTRIAGWCCP
jgi:hypothetical protein